MAQAPRLAAVTERAHEGRSVPPMPPGMNLHFFPDSVMAQKSAKRPREGVPWADRHLDAGVGGRWGVGSEAWRFVDE